MRESIPQYCEYILERLAGNMKNSLIEVYDITSYLSDEFGDGVSLFLARDISGNKRIGAFVR